jgi:hypothetical protein
MAGLGNIPSPAELIIDGETRATTNWYRWWKSLGAALADKQPLDADLTTIADNTTADRLWGTTTAGATTLITGISVSAGAFSGQISFPATQNPSADPNTLDDYEEGTWTPGITVGGSASGVTYAGQSGAYIKIGQNVLVTGRTILTNNGSGSGLVRVTGFPFLSSASQFAAIPMGYWTNTAGIVGNLVILLDPNATVGPVRFSGAATINDATEANILDTSDLIFSGCYRTAA